MPHSMRYVAFTLMWMCVYLSFSLSNLLIVQQAVDTEHDTMDDIRVLREQLLCKLLIGHLSPWGTPDLDAFRAGFNLKGLFINVSRISYPVLINIRRFDALFQAFVNPPPLTKADTTRYIGWKGPLIPPRLRCFFQRTFSCHLRDPQALVNKLSYRANPGGTLSHDIFETACSLFQIRLAQYLSGVGHPAEYANSVPPGTLGGTPATLRALLFLKASTDCDLFPSDASWQITVSIAYVDIICY